MTNQVPKVRCNKLTLDGKDLPGVATGDWALFTPHGMVTGEGERVLCETIEEADREIHQLVLGPRFLQGVGFFEEPCEILAERDLGR